MHPNAGMGVTQREIECAVYGRDDLLQVSHAYIHMYTYMMAAPPADAAASSFRALRLVRLRKVPAYS